MQIKWTELALDDLESIRVYISKDSQFYARQFIERLFDSTEKLQGFPQLGRRVPEMEERNDIRELIFQGYVLFIRGKPATYLFLLLSMAAEIYLKS